MDDIESFEVCQESKNFQAEQTMPPSIFTLDPILQNFPNLLHVAAYFGSMKCLTRLMKTDISLMRIMDSVGVTAVGFAVAGGQMEIVQLMDEKCEWAGALQIAALYHRHEAFDYLIRKGGNRLCQRLIQPFGSVLHQCAASDNLRELEFCLENDADINIRDMCAVFVIFVENSPSFCSHVWKFEYFGKNYFTSKSAN
jgi:hypothetical protein